jgi:cobalamin biosynthesis protein CobD/CbiB
MQIKFISLSSAQPPGLLGKILALVATVVLAVVALMFSAVLLAVILVVGVIGFAYLWWKTRAVRKQFREMQEFARNAQAQQAEVSRGEVYKGEIIEGEAVRVDETDVRIGR